MKFKVTRIKLEIGRIKFVPATEKFDRGGIKFGVGLWKTNFQYESWPEAPGGSAHQSA